MNDTTGNPEEVTETQDRKRVKEISPLGKSAMRGPADPEASEIPGGEFDITDWSDYPDGPKPDGPFRVLDKGEWDEARLLANKANAKLHRENPSLDGLEIHEVKPVKFGGDPQDIRNKIALTPEKHDEFSAWWDRKQREVEGKTRGAK